MKKLAPVLVLASLQLMFLGCIGGETESSGISEHGELKMAKALMIIAPSNFRDEELFHTKEELEKTGTEVVVASKVTGTITGSMGGTAIAEKELSRINVSDYDAIVFVGGPGSQTYYSDSEALSIAREAVNQSKMLAAICIAPGILANAGVLEGKRATIWDSGDGAYSRVLEKHGAVYTGEDVTIDGKIVTANGPQAARRFGKTIAELL